MDLDHRGHPEGVGEVEVETNYSQILFLWYNSGSSYLFDLVYLGCPTVEKEYWKHVTIHTVQSVECVLNSCRGQ